MKLLADLHTHSKYSRFSHGKDKIEQMVNAANEKGLVEIAITDHGYKHLCGTSVVKFAKAHDEIEEINQWSKTKVLLGIEADIISEDGTLDVDDDTISLVDVLIVGYHRLVKTDFVNFFGIQKKTKEAKEKATNAYINAIRKYPVMIVSHLDSILTTDLYEIGKVCAENGTLVEINNRHCNWTEEQVHDLIASGCDFIVSSDAHRADDVGEVDRAFEIIKKYKIPYDRIVNIELHEDEKTDEDREVDAYYGLYAARQQEKLEKEELLEEKKKTEFVNSLSDEMEDKLREIAREKGMYYEEVKDSADEVTEAYINYKNAFRETEDLIRQAKDYLNQQTLQEFDMQNTKVDDDSSFMVQEQPIVENEEIKEKIQQIEAKSVLNTENIKEEKIDRVLTEDEKVLGIFGSKQKSSQTLSDKKSKNDSMQKGAVIVKNVKGNEVSKNESVQTPAKEEKILKNGMMKNNQSLESFMQSMKNEENAPKEDKNASKDVKKEPKTIAKKGRGGVFIQIDDVEGDK